jgi:hypothetical protein
VVLDELDRSGVQVADGSFVTGGEGAEEMAGEQQDVRPAVPQGRQVEGQHKHPVVQVEPETAVRHRALEVGAGRRNETCIELYNTLAAQPTDFALLHGGQQLGLQRQGQFSNLVQEQRAAMRLLEEASTRLVRTGESAPGHGRRTHSRTAFRGCRHS